ncbi:MAG: TrkH family potassium uptake protein [Planctomycetota bacterium]|nr:TrkH family potassium uptake protein [Planctomycetota bacterium]
MNSRNVVSVLGTLLEPFALLLLLPGFIDSFSGRMASGWTFFGTAIVAFSVGRLLRRYGGEPGKFSRVEAMAVVAFSWLVAALFGAAPYVQQGFSAIDALFESMSGFTTTGSTIFLTEDFTRVTRGLIFWRSLTQWLGGMGIIVLFVAVLPALAVAGRQMFFTEAPGPEEEALTPRIRHTAAALWLLYAGLTALEATLLATVGNMSGFEAICHALTTLAAGGFSPHGQSLGGYGASAQWIVLVFMFLAGASFALQFRALRRPSRLVRDTEFKTYACIIGFSGLLIALLIAGTRGHDFEASLRHGLFQAASIVTTTGYASEDFNLWSHNALIVVGCLFFVGGCAGSAGGGPKVVRLIILAKFLAREVLTALHPRAVKVVRLGGRPLADETVRQIIGFMVAYITIFAGVAALAGLIEGDLAVGFTGSIVTLGNIGPGFGALGPMETFSVLSPWTKGLFILSMWVGRLEVMTVLVLLHPDVLRGFSLRRRRKGRSSRV